MDQTLTGSAGIASAETFGSADARMDQTIVRGSAGIPSEEAFPPPAGVFIDPATVPFSLYISY